MMRIRGQVIMLGVACALLSGCEILEPCKLSTAGIDGQWRLSHVNGDPIPPDGYPLPNRFEFLTSGKLFFATRSTSSRGCRDDDPINKGGFIAVFELRNSDKPASSVDGNFTYDLGTGDLILTSGGRSVPADRFGEEISMEQALPGLGTYRLTFRFVGRT